MSTLIYTGNLGKLAEFKSFFSAQNQIIGLKDLNHLTQLSLPEANENSDFFLANAFIKIFTALKFIYDNRDIKELNNIDSILVDDSGLCVPELNFLPGVHSAVYGGYPKDDAKNREKLATKIKLNSNEKDKADARLKAFFVCFLVRIQVVSIDQFCFIEKFSAAEAINFVNSVIQNSEKKLLQSVNLSEIGNSSSLKMSMSDFHKVFPKDIYLDICYGYCCGEVSAIEQNLIPGAGHGYDSQFYSNANKRLSFASISMEEKNKLSHRAFAIQALKEIS